VSKKPGLPPSAWRTITLDVPNRKYRTPRVYEQKVRPKERSFRQFFIIDLGHEEPTILLTNDLKSKAATIIALYAKRMLIENALSDAVRFFHIDALSSSVGFKVDFDMALLVLSSGLYRLFASRMRGYDDAQARLIFRDLIGMPADVAITDDEIIVRFHRRAPPPHRPRLWNPRQTGCGTVVERPISPLRPALTRRRPALGQFRSVEIQASRSSQDSGGS
jgi:hypothetical protein